MYKNKSFCRACGLGKPSIPTLKESTAAGPNVFSNKLIEILDLGVSPLANDFCFEGEPRQGFAPLKLMWCPRCTLAQLSVVVDPKVIYKNYPYVTSHSTTMRDHFSKLTDDLGRETTLKTVVEIGSNDGTYLNHLQDKGVNVIGIEPAENLANLAIKNGVPTRNEFFNERLARELSLEGVVPSAIVARHVFCHIDNWQETIHSLGILCGKETVIAIEVPYLLDTIKNCEWDQIYHEHLSYMTIRAMEHALEGSTMHIHGVNHYPIHGGAVVILLRRNDSEVPPNKLFMESLILDDMMAFAGKAEVLTLELCNKVHELVNSGNTVVGYGASAKATQWITACGFTRKQIKFVCDSTPQKQYKFMPGSDIPVVDEGALTRELPNYAILFAWNWRDECINKERIFASNGGMWIVPVPKLQII